MHPLWTTALSILRVSLLWAGAGSAVLGLTGGAAAKCLPIAGLSPSIVRAALPASDEIRLTFLGHSSFLIETPGGVSIVTDYNGVVKPPALPNIVTMNNAHETHYTDYVEPGIDLVLRGWSSEDGFAQHDHQYRDLNVWNVPTNVREAYGTRYHGNSIFVFEIGRLCIAHLGHLHHLLEDSHLAALGIIDVLLVPVDGSYTMAQELMVEVIEQIHAPLVIPMHYFGESTLARFLRLVEARGTYRIALHDDPELILSPSTLPRRTVLVLPGR